MKKQLFLLGLLGMVGFANAQEYDGKVGVNTETPMATLEIKAFSTGDKKEGLLIPRLAKETVISMTATHRTTLVESTLLYVTDEVLDTDNATFEGTGKGFYYYDRKGVEVGTAAPAARWVKVGSGAATVAPTEKVDINKVTAKVQMLPAPVAADSIDPSTGFVIVTQGGSRTVTLPAPPNNGEEVRYLHINNQTGSHMTFQGSYQPRNLGRMANGTGHILIGYKNVWYVAGGFY